MTVEDALNLEYAKQKVQEKLCGMSEEDFHLIVDKVIEKKSYGYIFQVTTEEYKKTGNPLLLPVGGGPLVYDAETGVIFFLGTAQRSEDAIREYDETRKPPR